MPRGRGRGCGRPWDGRLRAIIGNLVLVVCRLVQGQGCGPRKAGRTPARVSRARSRSQAPRSRCGATARPMPPHRCARLATPGAGGRCWCQCADQVAVGGRRGWAPWGHSSITRAVVESRRDSCGNPTLIKGASLQQVAACRGEYSDFHGNRPRIARLALSQSVNCSVPCAMSAARCASMSACQDGDSKSSAR